MKTILLSFLFAVVAVIPGRVQAQKSLYDSPLYTFTSSKVVDSAELDRIIYSILSQNELPKSVSHAVYYDDSDHSILKIVTLFFNSEKVQGEMVMPFEVYKKYTKALYESKVYANKEFSKRYPVGKKLGLGENKKEILDAQAMWYMSCKFLQFADLNAFAK